MAASVLLLPHSLLLPPLLLLLPVTAPRLPAPACSAIKSAGTSKRTRFCGEGPSLSLSPAADALLLLLAREKKPTAVAIAAAVNAGAAERPRDDDVAVTAAAAASSAVTFACDGRCPCASDSHVACAAAAAARTGRELTRSFPGVLDDDNALLPPLAAATSIRGEMMDLNR